MSRGGRLSVVLGAVAIAVGAFLLLNPGGDDEDATRTEAPTKPARTATEPSRTMPRKPQPPVLRGGSVKTIEVRRGSRVRFVARSDRAEEVHVHGYDISKDVAAGGSARFDFEATIEGIFEIEYELSHEQIGRLVVKP